MHQHEIRATLRTSRPFKAGMVLFAPGRTYLLGSLLLSGSVQLVVPADTVLQASAERSSYGRTQHTWYLLYFLGCRNCSLSGGGTVRGCAEAFMPPQLPPQPQPQAPLPAADAGSAGTAGSGHVEDTSGMDVSNWADPSCRVRRQCRPRLVGLVGCEHVALSDVALADSAFWTLHVRRSRHVELSGLRVSGNRRFPNNDGIDIDGSAHVTIRNCTVSTADDAHVLVEDCVLRSRSAAVKLGSESRADMTNITFRRVRKRARHQVLDSNRGLGIQLRDWGDVRDVAFEDVSVTTSRVTAGRWWGGGEPIYVTALPRHLDAWGRVGQLRNVSFRRVAATATGGLVVVAGSPESVGMAMWDVDIQLVAPAPGHGAEGQAGSEDGQPWPAPPPPPRSWVTGWLDWWLARPPPWCVELVARTVHGLQARGVRVRVVHADEASGELPVPDASDAGAPGARGYRPDHSWLQGRGTATGALWLVVPTVMLAVVAITACIGVGLTQWPRRRQARMQPLPTTDSDEGFGLVAMSGGRSMAGAGSSEDIASASQELVP
eukprot:XP_001694178.1 predicted protein [Chlamydomonas reinhardtii]